MLSNALKRQANLRGDGAFLVHADGVVSWARMLDVVARTATLLESRGIREGSRVLLAAENGPSYCYLWFALSWLSATCVPVHSQATDTALARIAQDVGASHVIGDDRLVARVVSAAPWLANAAASFANATALEAATASLPVCVAEGAPASGECSILYTSGTTGVPKGVVLPAEAFLAGGYELAQAIGVRSTDRILIALPLYHANPQIYAVMTALATGCSIAILERFVASEFLDAAITMDATGFTYVGTMLARLALEPAPRTRHSLRFCVGGGAPERVWTRIEDGLGIRVHELYGMTETGGWLTANRTGSVRHGSCGTVRPDMSCAILDANGTLLPSGHVGEIAARGLRPRVLFDGYHNQATLTRQRFRNGWFHTGDLGELDEDGYLYFRGRMDDMIRRGGENINPRDVEAILHTHPLIQDVAVVGVPDDVMGKEVKAVIVPLRDFNPTSLTQFLQNRLPRFAWPRYIELALELPKTSTQKIHTRELEGLRPGDIDLRGAFSERRRRSPEGEGRL